MSEYLKRQQAAFDEIVAVSTGTAGEIAEALDGWGWSRKEIINFVLWTGKISEGRGDNWPMWQLIDIKMRDERVVQTDGREWLTEVLASLTRRGWTGGEVMAARHYLVTQHLSNREIIEMRKMQKLEENYL